jgi:malate dehydrogenase (oxaloacetate-decarboxylating)(NADP+)
LINALDIANKKVEDIKIVMNGAGAAGIACIKLIWKYGAKKENTLVCDTKGVIYKGRVEHMTKEKEEVAVETDARTLSDAMKGADVFIGVSSAGAVSKDMVASMAKDPVLFAMANPDPEISPEDARSVRDDVIIATGRSDYPNQINNVMCFPFIFRGALDTRAKQINE